MAIPYASLHWLNQKLNSFNAYFNTSRVPAIRTI
jgi:hypothetical protein